MRFIVDAHLDLAYNALKYGRNLRLDLADLRRAESGQLLPGGRATVTFPELQKAGVGLVFGTLFTAPAGSPFATDGHEMTYRDAAGAHKIAMAQLDYYQRMADELQTLRLVGNQTELDEVVASHQGEGQPLLGIVPLMEGADPIREPEEAELWYERGLRVIGLAWDDTRYCPGAWRNGGPLTKDGRYLLEVMAGLGFILDLTHMSEKAVFEALDNYEGVVVATHSNARVLVPGARQFSNRQICTLAERDGVIGVVLYNAFLHAGYRKGDPKELVPVDYVVAHIDHICQVVGDAAHVGLGSDLDGGFGAADIPAGMDSVADLPLIADALSQRGYDEEDISNIMGGNWLRVLRTAWQ